jgi:hypothetical protein
MEMRMAVNPLQKQPARGPGRRFEKGRSGNPGGRPAGLHNRATYSAELLLDGEAIELAQVVESFVRAFATSDFEQSRARLAQAAHAPK